MAMRRIESFLLRIVAADIDQNQPQRWQGRIQHIASGAEQQIDELAQAIAFIAAHLGNCVDDEFIFDPVGPGD